jgi:spore germination protein YaaH
MDFVSQYADFLSAVYDAPARVQIYLQSETKEIAKIGKDTAIRYQGGVKSEVLKDLKKGDKVYVLEQMETWAKVKSEDSVIGYVENKRLKDMADEQIVLPGEYAAPVYTSISKDYPINLVWHQVTNVAANAEVDDLLANAKGLTTISPTWYFLNDNYGNFTSIADQSYVDNMHARGLEVWALIDNFTNEVDIAQILSTTTNRKTLINNLIQTTLAYNIDGINIDFEEVPQEAGEDYVQFLRELSIPCRQNGIVLSVDNYVPTEYTAHYGRAQQGEVIDYFIIMGYDEHYGGSSQAGSVASYGYVKAGIENTIKDVPASKVINAVPFYTRLWKIADGVSSEALAMAGGENILAQYGVTATWDEETQQNFAQFEADGATYQIWLEDERSLAAKLELMSGYRLAGVAAWKLGLEKASAWDAIETYLTANQANAPAQEEVLPEEVPVMQVIETDS